MVENVGGSTILLWSLMPKYLPLLSRLPIRSQQPNEVDYDKGASPCTLLRAKKETATSGCHHSPPHPQPPTPNPNPTPGTLLNMVINGKCCPCFLLVCFVCQLQNHQKMIIDTTALPDTMMYQSDGGKTPACLPCMPGFHGTAPIKEMGGGGLLNTPCLH